MSKEEYVVTEKPRLSASAILLIFLMLMVLLQSFMIFQMYQQISSLQNQLTILNAQLKILNPQVQQLNQRYGRIDSLLNIYLQTLVIRMYKEMFPNISEEEIRKMIEDLVLKQTQTNTNTTGFVVS